VSGGGYAAEIDRVYAQVDAWGAACSVELHFNGSENPATKGCLTLTSGTTKSLALAKQIHSRLVRVMGGEDDGIRTIGRHDRGGRSLWQGKAPAIMTEEYFGSNAAECIRAETHMDELAEAIYRGCTAFLKGA
jgi:N-acetylmuramoyl-L-alanine amidase